MLQMFAVALQYNHTWISTISPATFKNKNYRHSQGIVVVSQQLVRCSADKRR